MSQGNRPLSSHPAFRFMVAIWFAALLGFGTWVLPAEVFERAVAATGLSSVLPAAAPPLGGTARLTISVVAAMLGALLGLLVAGRAAAQPGDSELDAESELTALAEPEPPAETRRRPLLVREDLAEDLGADADIVGPEFDEDTGFSGAGDVADGEEPALVEETIAGPPGEDGPDHTAEPDDADVPDAFFAADAAGPDDSPVPEEDAAPVTAPPADSLTGFHPAPDDDLPTLQARLEDALAGYRRRMSIGFNAGNVTLLRPEDAGPEDAAGLPDQDPGAELRTALERLSQLSRDG